VSALLREQFPLLERTIDGRPILYLDSAATALKPWRVLEAERAYSTQFTANIHRGKHALSEEASEAYETARRRVARFLKTDPGQVVFVRNTTEALNAIASGLGLSKDDLVMATTSEHHSNLVPWMRAARVHLMRVDPTQHLSSEAVAAELDRVRPRVLALAHAGNVTGVIHPIDEIFAAARKRGVLTVLDAAQSAPHLELDPAELGCDYLAFSGHKMLGPAGIGVLWGRAEALERLEPWFLGGGTVDRVTATGYTLKRVPLRLEAGTPNVSGALGLAAAIDVLDEVGHEALARHEADLSAALERTLADLPGIRVLMARAAPRLAIAALAPTFSKLAPDHLARLLSDGHQIMVRSGYHCAHPLFDEVGIEGGAVRVSAYLYNSVEEIERFGSVLRSLLARLTG
jgi:cysteine desulfurase/selenocysteine lyase